MLRLRCRKQSLALIASIGPSSKLLRALEAKLAAWQWNSTSLKRDGIPVAKPKRPKTAQDVLHIVGSYHWSKIALAAERSGDDFEGYTQVTILVYCVRLLCPGGYLRLYFGAGPNETVARCHRSDFTLSIE